jgi:D-glycero-alpha-D-manno-heptose 1-phosphate guanylyltransferase
MTGVPQAVILLGGLGTRLRELHPDLPKALAPVAGKPFLDRQLSWLSDQDVASVILAAGYRAEQIEEHVASTWANRLEIVASVEPAPLGTGGAIRYCRQHLRPETVLVMNGDTLLPHLELKTFVSAHRASKATATIAVVPMKQPDRYGTVETNSAGAILRFREKASIARGLVNGGYYLLEENIIRQLPDGRAISLEQELFPVLAEEGNLFAAEIPPPLLDMGTPGGIEEMELFFNH